jgi:hypothetical protein
MVRVVKTALASQGAKLVGNAPGELAAVIAADTAPGRKSSRTQTSSSGRSAVELM